MTGILEIEEMEFFAYHGCFEAEQTVGNKFKVYACLHYNCDKAAVSDQITDALSYQTAYEIIAVEMMKRSHLLEHVGLRILDALYAAFPQLLYAKIKISKMNLLWEGKSVYECDLGEIILQIILEVDENIYLCIAKSQQGRLAERLGSGLQNRVQQFKSATDLKSLRKLSFEGFLYLVP